MTVNTGDTVEFTRTASGVELVVVERNLMKKRVVVTGGAGFLGAALVKHLLKEGHQVAVLDNFWRGKRANLAGHEDNASLFVIEGDGDRFSGPWTAAQQPWRG